MYIICNNPLRLRSSIDNNSFLDQIIINPYKLTLAKYLFSHYSVLNLKITNDYEDIIHCGVIFTFHLFISYMLLSLEFKLDYTHINIIIESVSFLMIVNLRNFNSIRRTISTWDINLCNNYSNYDIMNTN